MYYQTNDMNDLFSGGAGPDNPLIDWAETTSPFGQVENAPGDGSGPSALSYVYAVSSFVGGIGGAYHGYKRTKSAGWAFGWFVFGSILPIFAIPLALAQGFAKPKGS